jgi:hypothetical protein
LHFIVKIIDVHLTGIGFAVERVVADHISSIIPLLELIEIAERGEGLAVGAVCEVGHFIPADGGAQPEGSGDEG